MAQYKEKNGTWTVRANYREDGVHQTKVKRGFKSEREAKRWELDFRDGLITEPNIKFEKLVLLYVKDKKTNRKPSTITEIERVSKFYFSSLNNKLIYRIKIRDLLSIKNNLPDELSESYKNKILTILKGVMRFGIQHYQLNLDLNLITRFRTSKVSDKFSVWQPNQFDKAIQCCESTLYKDVFITLFRTGLRVGELRALYKSDYKDGYLTVNKSMKSFKQGVMTPKNSSSVRIIKLDNVSNQICLMRSKTKGLFLFGDDQPTSQSSANRWLRSTIKNAQQEHADIPYIRVHDLRHSHVSYLINNGANIVAVSKRIGHASVEQTLNTYTHLFKETEDLLISISDKAVPQTGTTNHNNNN